MAALVEVVLVAAAIALVVRLLVASLRFRRLELAIPGPPSLPIVGNVFDSIGITQDTVMSWVLDIWGGRYSELSRFSGFGRIGVFVTNPDHLQELFRNKDLLDKDRFFYNFMEPFNEGLLTLPVAVWRAHRRAFLPGFHQTVLDRFTPVVSAEALAFVNRVRPGEAQNVEDNLQSLSARSFLNTAVATDNGEERVARILPTLKTLVEKVTHAFSYRCVQPWLWASWVFRLTSTGRSIWRLNGDIEAFYRSVVSARREQLQQKKLEGDYEDSTNGKRRTLLDILLEPGDKLPLTDKEILAELQIFAAGAIDTSASTLSWALKTLSLRQDIQERLLEEVEEVLGKDAATRTTPISTEEINRLEYTERVLKETLRLLPAVPVIMREAKNEMDFCGHTLPAGATLIVNILGAHRHPGHWPDPLRFDPDRFLPEQSQGRHPYAYLPFSAGPRNCIGSRYAMMAMKTLLATLVPRYRIDPVDDGFTEPAEFPMTVGLATRMVGGARVVFTPRMSCAG